ncbi:ATP-grasp domain-containing protein [Pseudoalteromonas caenipelagi]|uniref:ATP-grasp domain-containing protein n=1 Tax=Pseudoalteromonas caenipelagi TaxID=2726988 RepID=UPI001C113DBC|nr:ATP-grasp domain-containing protein [Pseudoalteromonas caenipelagi]
MKKIIKPIRPAKEISKGKILNNIIAIVDALSTGNELAQEFINRGVKCVHIVNDSSRKTRVAGFIETIDCQGNEEEVVAELARLNVSHVIAGSDSGVELAEKLASMLGLAETNHASTTELRRNKFCTHQALASQNIRAIKQFKSTSVDELINWAQEHNSFPLVVKPLNSGASDGVTICDSLDDVKRAVVALLGKKNLLGYINHELLVQEFIEGTQYFVNTLSWNGKVYVTDIWEQVRSRCPGKAYLFEGMLLCDSSSTTGQLLSEYTCDALAAIELQYGPAHNEVILTKSGPVLIESNARLMGASIDEESFIKALGYTQVSMCVDMYLDPETFINKTVTSAYQLNAHLAEVSLLFKKDGQLTGIPGIPMIEELTSFSNFSGLPETGIEVTITVDTIGLPGFVYLVNSDSNQLLSDFSTLLKYQRDDLIFDIQNNN